MVALITQLVIRYEEINLDQKFGQDYLSYKANVRRWI
jgi:protein-S-isoprenylcysteine O-methyltransferase Ste14